MYTCTYVNVQTTSKPSRMQQRTPSYTLQLPSRLRKHRPTKAERTLPSRGACTEHSATLLLCSESDLTDTNGSPHLDNQMLHIASESRRDLRGLPQPPSIGQSHLTGASGWLLTDNQMLHVHDCCQSCNSHLRDRSILGLHGGSTARRTVFVPGSWQRRCGR